MMLTKLYVNECSQHDRNVINVGFDIEITRGGREVIRKKQNRIKWYIEFISLDINQLKIIDLEQKMHEYGRMWISIHDEIADYNMSPIEISKTKKLIIDDRNQKFANFLPDTKSPLIADFVKEQEQFTDFVHEILEKSQETHSDKSKELCTRKSSNDLVLTQTKYDGVNCFETSETVADDMIEAIKYDFIACLKGVPVDSFKKCPECDNWFFQPTKKEKIYCNNRCASRHIVRKKRLEQKEANPKLHAEEKAKEAGR
jgi:hypothetical protein